MLITILVGEPDRGTFADTSNTRRTSACTTEPRPWNIADAWNIRGAWNIAVRTRGVFTHRDDFQKPACVERGLVRTGKALGWPGLVRTGKTLGRPPLACTGITPVIPGSAAPPPDAILRPSARPVYALFLEPAPLSAVLKAPPPPADAILKIKNICMKTAELCKYFFIFASCTL